MKLDNSMDFQDGEDAYSRGDYATALRKSRPLAEQGHAGAQYRLGVMYGAGQGVQRDSVEAQKWFSLAAAQGFEGASENRDRIARINSILATGDGSRERPYVVSSVKEEYLILRHFEKKLTLQALANVDGRRMDIMSCEDGTVYHFDISTFFGRLTEQL